MKKLLFIVNPRSGKNQIKPFLCDIIDLFVANDYDVRVHTTQCQGDAHRIAAQIGSRYDLVVCSGGDGTLNEVSSGILEIENDQKPMLGYIPAGTTNDFAKSLGIESDMIKAADNVIHGVPFYCDMGSFNNIPFMYVAAFGVFTQVSYATPQEAKNLWGHMAYVVEGIKSLSSIKSYKMTLEYADKKIEDEYIYGMITNSISVGGFKSISAKVMELDDGLMEVLFIKTPKTMVDWQGTLAALLMQKVDERYMCMVKTDKIKVTSDEEINWTLDGENGGIWKEVEVLNLERKIQIIRPKDAIEEEHKENPEGMLIEEKIDIVKNDEIISEEK